MPDDKKTAIPRNAPLEITRVANGFVVVTAYDVRRGPEASHRDSSLVFNDFGHTNEAPGSCLAAFLRDHFDKPEDGDDRMPLAFAAPKATPAAYSCAMAASGRGACHKWCGNADSCVTA